MNIILEMLPNPLRELYESYEFEEFGGILINKVDFSVDCLKFQSAHWAYSL